MKRYVLWYEFTETEAQAMELCERINKEYTPYMRKHHKASYTPWKSSSNTDKAHFVVWYRRNW